LENGEVKPSTMNYKQLLGLTEKRKCGALNRNCNTPLPNGERCPYHFKKDETKCPVCGAERRRCKQWASRGATRCKYHGGMNQKHRKYDEYGLPVNFFSPEELAEVRKNIVNEKKVHDVVYQMAWVTFRRMADSASKMGAAGDAFVFESCCKFFKEIGASMRGIEAKDAEGPKLIVLDPSSAEMYSSRLRDFSERMLRKTLAYVFDMIAMEPGGAEIASRVKGKLPDSIKSMINQPIATEAKLINNEQRAAG
jgi:hypothetical protein